MHHIACCSHTKRITSTRKFLCSKPHINNSKLRTMGSRVVAVILGYWMGNALRIQRSSTVYGEERIKYPAFEKEIPHVFDSQSHEIGLTLQICKKFRAKKRKSNKRFYKSVRLALTLKQILILFDFFPKDF